MLFIYYILFLSSFSFSFSFFFSIHYIFLVSLWIKHLGSWTVMIISNEVEKESSLQMFRSVIYYYYYLINYYYYVYLLIYLFIFIPTISFYQFKKKLEQVLYKTLAPYNRNWSIKLLAYYHKVLYTNSCMFPNQ